MVAGMLANITVSERHQP